MIGKVTKKNVAYKYRLGRQWIAGTYEPQYGTWEESRPVDYYTACRIVRNARINWDTKTQQYKGEVR